MKLFASRSVAVVPIEGVPNDVQRFRGGPIFEAHRLDVSLNSKLESNDEKRECQTMKTIQVEGRCTVEVPREFYEHTGS